MLTCHHTTRGAHGVNPTKTPPPGVATNPSSKRSRVGSGPFYINSLFKHPTLTTHLLLEDVRELVDADPEDNLASTPGHEAANPTPVDRFGV